MLNHHDHEYIAALHGHPGFKALLKIIDEADEVLLEKLEEATTHSAETDLLNRWRASRRVKKLLEHAPENFASEIGILTALEDV